MTEHEPRNKSNLLKLLAATLALGSADKIANAQPDPEAEPSAAVASAEAGGQPENTPSPADARSQNFGFFARTGSFFDLSNDRFRLFGNGYIESDRTSDNNYWGIAGELRFTYDNLENNNEPTSLRGIVSAPWEFDKGIVFEPMLGYLHDQEFREDQAHSLFIGARLRDDSFNSLIEALGEYNFDSSNFALEANGFTLGEIELNDDSIGNLRGYLNAHFRHLFGDNGTTNLGMRAGGTAALFPGYDGEGENRELIRALELGGFVGMEYFSDVLDDFSTLQLGANVGYWQDEFSIRAHYQWNAATGEHILGFTFSIGDVGGSHPASYVAKFANVARSRDDDDDGGLTGGGGTGPGTGN